MIGQSKDYLFFSKTIPLRLGKLHYMFSAHSYIDTTKYINLPYQMNLLSDNNILLEI